MPLKASQEQTFIFNKENIQAYLTDLHQGDRAFDPHKPLSVSDKRSIQDLKKRLFTDTVSENVNDIFQVSKQERDYLFFLNPKVVTKRFAFNYELELIVALPGDLQEKLLGSDVSWSNFYPLDKRATYPFKNLHTRQLSLSFLHSSIKGIPLDFKPVNKYVALTDVPEELFEQTSPVIANIEDFNDFLTLSKNPDPKMKAYLKKVIIKDSFKQAYADFQKISSDQLRFWDLRPFGINYDPHAKAGLGGIQRKDPVLTEAGLSLYKLSKSQIDNLYAQFQAISQRLVKYQQAVWNYERSQEPSKWLLYSFLENKLVEEDCSTSGVSRAVADRHNKIRNGLDPNYCAFGRMRDLVKKRKSWFGNSPAIIEDFINQIKLHSEQSQKLLESTEVCQNSKAVLAGKQAFPDPDETLANLPDFIRAFEDTGKVSRIFGQSQIISQINSPFRFQESKEVLKEVEQSRFRLKSSKVTIDSPAYVSRLLALKKEIDSSSRNFDIDLSSTTFKSRDLTDPNTVTILSSLVWQRHPELFTFPEKGQPIPTFSNQATWPAVLQQAFKQPEALQKQAISLTSDRNCQPDDFLSPPFHR